VLLFDCYYASHFLQCLAGLGTLSEEIGDMGVTLKSAVQAGGDPGFALEIGSLMVHFQYYQLQSLVWSWLAENASFTGKNH
jgi:hypothetical protein